MNEAVSKALRAFSPANFILFVFVLPKKAALFWVKRTQTKYPWAAQNEVRVMRRPHSLIRALKL